MSWKTRERERNKNGKLEIDHGSKRLKICMERGSERTRKPNDFCFFHSAACFFFIDQRLERGSALTQDLFLCISVVWLAPFRQRRQKRFSFPSARFDTLHDYVVKLPVLCRHSSGGGDSIQVSCFFFRRCAVGPPDHLCPFGAIFYNTFFTSHLVARASHWCLARHTVFWKQ